MDHGAEIIDFFQPLENDKNLFVANIITKSPDGEETINGALHEAFSRFGLVYEIQVLQAKLKTHLRGNHSFRVSDVNTTVVNTTVVNADCQPSKMEDPTGKLSDPETKVVHDGGAPCLWYAFVKFYSSKSALEAKRALHLTTIVGLEKCKVNFAKRKKTVGLKSELQVRQCQDLANFYLGFHGWSSCVRVLKGEMIKPVAPEETRRYHQLCVVDLDIRAHGLQTTGLGLSEDTDKPQERWTVGSVFARCKKRAHQEALRKAFSTVLLVVLSSGKVYPEINISRQEHLMRETSAHILNLSSEPISGKTSPTESYNEGLLSSNLLVQEDCGMWSDEKKRKSKQNPRSSIHNTELVQC